MKKILIFTLTLLLINLFAFNAFAFNIPIQLDGDFADWVDKPFYDSEDNNPDTLEGVRQLKWHLNTDEDMLYIMAYFAKSPNNGKVDFSTQLKTDFGNFNVKTDAEVESGTVMVSGNNESEKWSIGGNWLKLENDGSLFIEYGIPMKELTEEMDWGYLIKFRLNGGFGDAPKNSWIELSTISTYPIIGIALCILAGLIGLIFYKRKKSEC